MKNIEKVPTNPPDQGRLGEFSFLSHLWSPKLKSTLPTTYNIKCAMTVNCRTDHHRAIKQNHFKYDTKHFLKMSKTIPKKTASLSKCKVDLFIFEFLNKEKYL